MVHLRAQIARLRNTKQIQLYLLLEQFFYIIHAHVPVANPSIGTVQTFHIHKYGLQILFGINWCVCNVSAVIKIAPETDYTLINFTNSQSAKLIFQEHTIIYVQI